MRSEEAKKMLKAKLECFKREISGTDLDCIYKNCDDCNLCYEQGYMREQQEALDLAIKVLEAQPCEDAVSREAVKELVVKEFVNPQDGMEEWRNAVNDVVEEILHAVETMPSVTHRRDLAETSQDCISREEINEFINVQLTDNEEWASSATNEGRWVEEKKYLYGVEILEGLSEYVNDLSPVKPKYTDEEIDKAQAVEQAYVDKMVELAVEELRREWLNSFDTSSATKCFEAVNLLKQRLEGEE